LLAGCSGNGGGGDGTDGDGDGGGDGGDGGGTETQATGGEPLDPEFTAVAGNFIAGGTSFSNRQFNVFISGQEQAWALLFGRLAMPIRDGFEPSLAESWSFPSTPEEGTTCTITLREGATWHGGEPVTAQDYVTQQQLNRYVFGEEFGIWAFVESVEASEEKTVEVTLSSKVNPTILKNKILLDRLDIKHDVYNDYLTRFEGASSEDEKKQIRSDIQSEPIEEAYGNHLYTFVRKSSDRARYELYEDHWNQEAIEVLPPVYDLRGIAFENLSSAVQSNTIETSSRTWPIGNWTEKDNWTVRSQVWALGEGWGFNLSHEHFGKRKVRQAFAHMLDFNPIFVDWAVGDAGISVSRAKELRKEAMPTIKNGLSVQQTDAWFENPEDTFSSYEKDNEKAMALLEEAGYSKDGGTVMTPDGNPWKPTVPAPSGWRLWAEGVVNQMQDFGIQAQLQQTGQFWSSIVPSGVPDDGGTAPWLWGGQPFGQSNPHPFYSFQPYVGDGDYGKRLSWPDKVEVPMPVGEPEGSLEAMTRQDIIDKVVTLQQTSDDAQTRTLTRELAWIHNQLLPVIPLRQGIDNQHISTDHWAWPEEGSNHDFAKLAWDHLAAGWPKAKTE
jgi:peptide/nickel transport system substrate-binding protein